MARPPVVHEPALPNIPMHASGLSPAAAALPEAIDPPWKTAS
jgi:hypothetical protein